MVDHEVAWKFITKYEGIEPKFYLDSFGYVTYGCGNHAALSQAILLNWETEGRAATDAEVTADYIRVKAAPPTHVASWYRGYSKCRLSDSSIRKLFNDRIDEFNTELPGHFPGFNSLPDAAQLAVLDMAFNLGEAKLIQSFPTFVKAIKLGEYTIASLNCHRLNPNPDIAKWDPTNLHEQRQIAVRDMLLSCVPV